MRRALLVLLVAACGSELEVVPERILPPNTREACDRTIYCGVITENQRDACLNCVETVADKWNAEALAFFGDGNVPALGELPCSLVSKLANETRMLSCIVGTWYGPK